MIKKIIKYLRYSWTFVEGYKNTFFLDILLKIVNLIASLFSPILYAKLITAISSKQKEESLLLLLFIILVQALSIFLKYFIGKIESKLSIDINTNAQKKLFRKISAIPPYKMNNYNDGEIYGLITRDATSPIGYIFTLLNGAFNIITIVGIGGIVLALSWQLSIVMLATYPFIYILNHIYGKKLREKKIALLKKSDGFISFFKNIITSLNVVKENSGADKIEDSFELSIEGLKTQSYEMELCKLKNNNALNIIGLINYIFVNAIGVLLVVCDKLLFSSFVAFNSYSTKFSSALNNIVSLNANLQPAFVVFERLEKIELLFSTAENEKLKQKEIDITNRKLLVNNLGICLSDHKIFDNVCFEVNPGQIIKLRGKNGCGKTTLLKILMREYQISAGMVYIGDLDLTQIRYESIQKNFCYLKQNAPLLHVSLYDNLTLFANKKTIEENKVIDVCKLVGLWEDIEKLPMKLNTLVDDGFNLSAGQIQKLQFARAILRKPLFLLVDEVTANLDKETILIVLDLCEKMKAEGCTIIYISHMDETKDITDKYFDF